MRWTQRTTPSRRRSRWSAKGCSAGSGSSSASVRWCASATSSSPARSPACRLWCSVPSPASGPFSTSVRIVCRPSRPNAPASDRWSARTMPGRSAPRAATGHSELQSVPVQRRGAGADRLAQAAPGRGGATAVRQPGGRPAAAARAVRRWIPGNLAGGLLAPGYAADLQLPQGALQLEAEHGEREGLQPCSFRPSEDLPPGDDRPGARSGTRGCGAIRGAAPAAGRRNAGAAFAELPHQGADPALQELVLRPLRGLRRRARLLQLVHLPERELLQRPWRALPAPAVRSGGTRRDRLPPVDDDCPAQGSEDRFQRFAEHPDSRRA